MRAARWRSWRMGYVFGETPDVMRSTVSRLPRTSEPRQRRNSLGRGLAPGEVANVSNGVHSLLRALRNITAPPASRTARQPVARSHTHGPLNTV